MTLLLATFQREITVFPGFSLIEEGSQANPSPCLCPPENWQYMPVFVAVLCTRVVG
jgi:hypothetical protein